MTRQKPPAHTTPPRENTVGQVVRARREELDMSQEALGECAGITQNEVSRLEVGRKSTNPHMDRLRRIANCLGMQPGDLLIRARWPWTQDRYNRIAFMDEHELSIIDAVADALQQPDSERAQMLAVAADLADEPEAAALRDLLIALRDRPSVWPILRECLRQAVTLDAGAERTPRATDTSQSA